MELSVVIPCHGGVEDTRACLGTLSTQQGTPGMEILVVDNASPDGTGDLGREFNRVRVLRQDRNLGFAGGVNAGLRAARGEWIMVLNNDTLAATHMVQRLLRTVQGDSRIGMAGPVSNFVKGPALVGVGNLGETEGGRAEVEGFLTESFAGRIQDVETLAGLCLLFHRSLPEQIGYLDEGFGFGNFEDDDFCLRARLVGHRLVIVRDAFLHHHGMRTFKAMGLDYDEELHHRAEVFRRKWREDPAGAAHLAYRRNRLDEAATWARSALAAHPAWPDAHFILGRHAADHGRPERAIEHLRSYLAWCPLHPEAVSLLVLQILSRGDVRSGLRLLVWALQHCNLQAAEAANLLLRYGRWCLDRGRDTDALRALADASELDPESASLQNLLGVAHLRTGQPAEALPRLERALELGCPEAHTNLGICLWRLDDPAKALRHFAQAVGGNPSDPSARKNLRGALEACQSAGIDTRELLEWLGQDPVPGECPQA